LNYKNKRVLITAGPTWVPIDKVRVISNIATGQTGILLAKKLCSFGAKVTLVLGPVGSCCLDKRINLIRFNYFDELKLIIRKELTSRRYCLMVHTAAVSDYEPERTYSYKVKSNLRTWRLNLKSTPKIIGMVKKYDPSISLVGFKFGPGLTKDRLISQAVKLMDESKADFIVANKAEGKYYSAYILSRNCIRGAFNSKLRLINELVRQSGENLCRN
jgi:phosphopantothenoylcysteine decarboxylase / phosphopantothenate---cysteine ligase